MTVLNLIKRDGVFTLVCTSSCVRGEVKYAKNGFPNISAKGRNIFFPDGILKSVTPTFRLSNPPQILAGTILRLPGQQTRHEVTDLRLSGRQTRHKKSSSRFPGQQSGHEKTDLRLSGRQSGHEETSLRPVDQQTGFTGPLTRSSGLGVCFRFGRDQAQPPPPS